MLEITVVRKKTGSKYRWKQVGFSSSRKYQEYLRFFKKEQCESAGCNMDRRLHSYSFGYDITTHHVDENKFNNHPNNLQTLCAFCHARIDPSFHLHWRKVLKRNRKGKR